MALPVPPSSPSPSPVLVLVRGCALRPQRLELSARPTLSPPPVAAVAVAVAVDAGTLATSRLSERRLSMASYDISLQAHFLRAGFEGSIQAHPGPVVARRHLWVHSGVSRIRECA